MKLLNLFCGIAVCLLGTTACSDHHEPKELYPNKRGDIALSVKSKEASVELLDFYTDFTTQAIEMNLNNKEKTDKNTIVSPLSTAMLLGMIANGMEDKNEVQKIANYIGVSDMKALNELSRTLLTSLPSVDNQSEFILKNAIWANKDLSFFDTFSSIMSQDYQAKLELNDFSNEKEVVSTINRWCSDQTNGRITTAIDNISASDLAILINAILFRSKWENEFEFDVKETKKASFHGFSKQTTADFMVSSRKRRWYSVSPNFSSCTLSLGNGAFYLNLVLPDDKMSPDKISHLYNKEEAIALSESSQQCSVIVEIPKFKLNGTFDLKQLLEKAGVISMSESILWSMFSPTAEGGLIMKQNTSFEIDEKGATAAVVSVGEMTNSALPIDPNKEYTMVFDRPFYFFLRETSTGTCLLSGLIADID